MINTVCALGSIWLQTKKAEFHASLEAAKTEEKAALIASGRIILNAEVRKLQRAWHATKRQKKMRGLVRQMTRTQLPETEELPPPDGWKLPRLSCDLFPPAKERAEGVDQAEGMDRAEGKPWWRLPYSSNSPVSLGKGAPPAKPHVATAAAAAMAAASPNVPPKAVEPSGAVAEILEAFSLHALETTAPWLVGPT